MSEWIDWDGMNWCPVPAGSRFEIRFRGLEEGAVDTEVVEWKQCEDLRWTHTGGIGDILAYRVLSDARWPMPESKPSNPKDIVGVRKAPMSTVSAPVMAELGVAMLEGAAKYGRHNYRAVGVRSSVYYDATMRHLFSWWEGEDTDPDSGLSHVTKAIASLVVLRDAMLQSKVEDDRPPRAAAFYPGLNARAAVMLDKHADKAPHHYTLADGPL